MTTHTWTTDTIHGQRCAACGARRVWLDLYDAKRFLWSPGWHMLEANPPEDARDAMREPEDGA